MNNYIWRQICIQDNTIALVHLMLERHCNGADDIWQYELIIH